MVASHSRCILAFTCLCLGIAGNRCLRAKEDVLSEGHGVPADDRKLYESFQTGLNRLIEEGRNIKIETIVGQLHRSSHPMALPHIPTRKMALPELYQNCRNGVLVVGHLYNCTDCGRQHPSIAGGFAITESGVIVTSYHVVNRPDSLVMGAMTADGRVFSVKEVLAADKEGDVAILQLDDSGLAPLALSPEVSVGASVAVIGHPANQFYTLTPGIVSRHFALQINGRQVPWIASTADIGAGVSGAPLLNECGVVLGVASRTRSTRPTKPEDHQPPASITTSLFTPAEAVLRLIRGPASNASERPTPAVADHTDRALLPQVPPLQPQPAENAVRTPVTGPVSVATFLKRPSTEKPGFAIAKENLEFSEDMQSCVENLKKIDGAIVKYHEDHGKPPDWLSDLVPDYLSAETLLCPKDPAHASLSAPDPKLPCSYSWQLSSASSPFMENPVPYRTFKERQVPMYGGVVPMVRCMHHRDSRILNLSIDGRIYWSRLVWESLFQPAIPQSNVERLSNRPMVPVSSSGSRVVAKVSLEHTTDLREWGIGYSQPLAIHLSADEPPQTWRLPQIDDAVQRRFWAQQSFGRKTTMNIVVRTPHSPEAGPWDVFVAFDTDVDFSEKVPVTIRTRSGEKIEFAVAYEAVAKQPYAIWISPNTSNAGRYSLAYHRACIRTGTTDVLGRQYGIALIDDDGDGLYSHSQGTAVLISRKVDGHRTHDNRATADSPIRIGESDYFTIEISDDGSSCLLRAAEYGILAGSVMQESLRTPISHARVRITPYEFEASTDPSGRYEMRLPVGKYYEAEISARGYIPQHIRRIPWISNGTAANLSVNLSLAKMPRSGEVTLYDGDSFHFLSGQRHKHTGGDFYFRCHENQSRFLANNVHQGGLVDLGPLQSSLDAVRPPMAEYSRFGVLAVIGHVYVSPARQGEYGCHIIFRVTEINEGKSCTLNYYYRQSESSH